MAKSIGSIKTGGRVAGTPNKRTLSLIEKLDSLGIDPVIEIIEHYSTLEAKEKITVMMNLLPYILPKRKPIEVIEQPFESLMYSASLELLKDYNSRMTQRIKDIVSSQSDYEKEKAANDEFIKQVLSEKA